MRGLTPNERKVLTVGPDTPDVEDVMRLENRGLCCWEVAHCLRCGEAHSCLVPTSLGLLALRLDALAKGLA